MPEAKEQEDMQWHYFNCEECDTRVGVLDEEDVGKVCPNCTQTEVIKEYNVVSDYEKLEDPSVCLQECIKTDDKDTMERIKAECAANGCNVCLSQTTGDEIEWPKHYNMGKIQPIDAIEDWKLDFRLANAVKYIARAGKKDPASTKKDLEKALWYIRRYIDKEL